MEKFKRKCYNCDYVRVRNNRKAGAVDGIAPGKEGFVPIYTAELFDFLEVVGEPTRMGEDGQPLPPKPKPKKEKRKKEPPPCPLEDHSACADHE